MLEDFDDFIINPALIGIQLPTLIKICQNY